MAKRRPAKKKVRVLSINARQYEHRKDNHNVDGESRWMLLRLFEGDSSLRTQILSECCDCGLEHLYTFEVYEQQNGTCWLNKRAYRVRDGRPQHGKGRRKKGKRVSA